MAHLVCAWKALPATQCRAELERVLTYLVARARDQSVRLADLPAERWGCLAKRFKIDLGDSKARPSSIQKDKENIVELINMIATMERLVDALAWILGRDPQAQVVSCDPTTSTPHARGRRNGKGSPALLSLGVPAPDLHVRGSAFEAIFEVADIISEVRDGNGKEKSSLRNLGCETSIPEGPIARYLVVPEGFSAWLCRTTRRWRDKHFAYDDPVPVGTTHLLRVRPPDHQPGPPRRRTRARKVGVTARATP
jgi:hypothetical protein